jgi:apolipoprotein N-acyltransferase
VPTADTDRNLNEPRASVATAAALAGLGGILHFVGFAGYGIWPLALGCLVPLWLAVDRVAGRHGLAALLGFVFGWVSYAGGYLWLWSILDIFLGGNRLLGAIFWSADASWFAGRYAIYALLYSVVRRRSTFEYAALPPLLVVEWLYPLLFPVYLGHALANGRYLVQMTDVGGPLLLSAFVCATNVAVYRGWQWLRGRQRAHAPLRVGALIGAAWLAAAGYGAVRVQQIQRATAAAATLRVGVVQGNLGLREKGANAERDHARYLEQTRELLSSEPDLDLVVWPETVYTRGIRGPLPVSGELVRRDIHTPLLFGAAFVSTRNGRRSPRNAALLVGRDGVIRSGYEKNLLIPFTEYIPFVRYVPALRAYLSETSRFDPALQATAVELASHRISVPICYEAVRPDFVRAMVRDNHAELIVTLANDAWFGRSQGAPLHLSMARLRAIELRRALVRATNSGISAVIDPDGSYRARSGLMTRENLTADVPLLNSVTLYARFGNWVGWLAGALVAVGIVRSAASHRRL